MVAALRCHWPRRSQARRTAVDLGAEEPGVRAGLSWGDRCGEVKTAAARAQLSPPHCGAWDTECPVHSLHSASGFSPLGMAHPCEERPQFPPLQNGNGDPACLFCWQPHRWLQTFTFLSLSVKHGA